jgi:hypothetical protein
VVVVTIFINPGSGPVVGASLDEAKRNITHFIGDLVRPGRALMLGPTEPRDMGDGRWEFDIQVGARWLKIEMPGLPIDQVRFIDPDSQNIWDFPRLYVDGSSWVWLYAIDIDEFEDES